MKTTCLPKKKVKTACPLRQEDGHQFLTVTLLVIGVYMQFFNKSSTSRDKPSHKAIGVRLRNTVLHYQSTTVAIMFVR
jgi:hypothetical protein